MWIDTLLSGFAGHPTVAAWDLGHDSATTVRPLRTAAMVAWVAEIAGRIHARGDRCRMTLGAGDVLVARGTRLQPLGQLVDRIDIAVMPQRLRLGQDWPQIDSLMFLAALAQRLAGDVDLGIQMCIASGATPGSAGGGHVSSRDPGAADPGAAAAYASRILPALAEAGIAGIGAWVSHGLRGNVPDAAPYDRWPSLVTTGLIDTHGSVTPWGDAWSACAKTNMAITQRAPWPEILDATSYYANLPDASKDLFTSWHSGQSEHPAIVG